MSSIPRGRSAGVEVRRDPDPLGAGGDNASAAARCGSSVTTTVAR